MQKHETTETDERAAYKTNKKWQQRSYSNSLEGEILKFMVTAQVLVPKTNVWKTFVEKTTNIEIYEKCQEERQLSHMNSAEKLKKI